MDFCKIETISSKYQTANWRKECFTTNSSIIYEKYQKSLVSDIFKKECSGTTHIRLFNDGKTVSLCKEINPYKFESGFDYSEDFDGKIIVKDKTYLFNFKMICGIGGIQTRSLKQVYNFITSQILLVENTEDIFFINILDGDGCFKFRRQFDYLLNKKYKRTNPERIFMGDSMEFKEWYDKNQ